MAVSWFIPQASKEGGMAVVKGLLLGIPMLTIVVLIALGLA